MADISMCSNGDQCPKKMTCYRWTAVPNPYGQSTSTFYNPKEECKSYLPDEEYYAKGTVLVKKLEASLDEAIGQSYKKAKTAVKHDAGKVDFTYIPNSAMREISKAFMFGAEKYDSENWAKGFKFRRPAAAALRHIYAWLSGEDKDPESGITHLAHACCCLIMLIHFQVHKTGTDDRYIEGKVTSE